VVDVGNSNRRFSSKATGICGLTMNRVESRAGESHGRFDGGRSGSWPTLRGLLVPGRCPEEATTMAWSGPQRRSDPTDRRTYLTASFDPPRLS
jgi:hypothetical protein